MSESNEFHLHEKEKLFPYQRLSTYPRFETEVRGYAGVRVEMIVEVHSGTVLEDAFSIWRQICPPRKSHNAL